MPCCRNVNLSVCSDDAADLASRFFAFFIACRCEKFDPMRMFLNFEGFLNAQIGVTSNGCLDDVN